jgi:hypothetical protein
VEGGVNLLGNLAGDIIDSTEAADFPSKGGEFARQPMGVGVEHTAAEDLTPDSDELHAVRVNG